MKVTCLLIVVERRREGGHMKQNFTMKDMAECERPYERCLMEGPAALTDAELLAVILRSGSQKQNALVTAQKILKPASHP